MTSPVDEAILPSAFGPARVAYALGVLLDKVDFRDEQSYHRGRLARALKYLFGTGTVAGLGVSWDADDQRLLIEPGLALDAVGRLVEVPRRVAIRLWEVEPGAPNWFAEQRRIDRINGWFLRQGVPTLVADVFLRFFPCAHARRAPARTGIFDALSGALASRERDGYELALVIREEARRIREAESSGRPPPPLPSPNDLELLATRPAAPRRAILDWYEARILSAWREEADSWVDGDRAPLPLSEHLGPRSASPSVPGEGFEDASLDFDPTSVGRDATSILLARLEVAVRLEGDPPPSHELLVPALPDLAAQPVPDVDNRIRRLLSLDAFSGPEEAP